MLSRLKCLSRTRSASSLTSVGVWSPSLNHGTKNHQQQKAAMEGGTLSESDQNVLRCYQQIERTDVESIRNDHNFILDFKDRPRVLEDENLKNTTDRGGGRMNSAFTTKMSVPNCWSFLSKDNISQVNCNFPLLKRFNDDRSTLLLKSDRFGNQIRTKFSWTFKNTLIQRLSRDPELDKIMKLVEKSSAEKSNVNDSAARRKVKRIPLANLLMGCTSPQHLFDLMVPYMERDEMDLKDYLIALEQLQILVYQDFVKKYPTLSDGQIPILYLTLTLDGLNETAFQSVNNNPTFIEMCRNFNKYAPSMTPQETITCFFGTTFLNVSFESPLMISLYENIQRMPDDNHSLFDISMLFQAVRAYIRPDIMTVVHIVPKLKCYINSNKRIPNDKKTFYHLGFLLEEKFNLQLSSAALTHICEEMYRICKETGILEDPLIATSFLHTVHRIYRGTERVFDSGRSYGMDKLSSSVLNKLEIMTDMAFEWLDQNVDRLPPSVLSKFWFEVRTLRGTDVRRRVQQRAVHLILSKQLKVKDIVRLGGIGTDDLQLSSDTVAEIAQEIRSTFEHISHSSLLEMLKYWHDDVIQAYGLGPLINENIVKHARTLLQFYSSANTMFTFLLFRKSGQLTPKLHADFQQLLQETAESNMKYSLGSAHHVNVFLYLIRQKWLSPPCVQILASMAPKVLPKMTLKQIERVSSALSVSHSQQPYWEKKLYMNNYDNYKAAILCVLINTTRVAFHRYLSTDFTDTESILRSIQRLLHRRYNDPLFFEALLEQILHVSKRLQTKKDFQLICSILKIVRYYQKDIMANLMAFALKNQSEMWRTEEFLGFVETLAMMCTQEDLVKAEMMEFMHDFVETNFPLYSLHHQLRLMILCNRLGVHIDSVMKRVFNLEYLQQIDALITGGDLGANNARKAIFLLNRDACIDYPHLNIPWFQPHIATNNYKYHGYGSLHHMTRMAEQPWVSGQANHNSQSYGNIGIPLDLSWIITSAVGGRGYVGANIPVEYGFTLWRVVLMDENNQPVEFREDNFKYANELGLKRYCFWYHGDDPTGKFQKFATSSRRLDNKEYNQIRQLEKMGYNSVLIYDTEWYSIGLMEPADKMEFLQGKLATSEKRCLQTSTVLSEERVSVGVSHMLPVDGDTVRVATPSQI